MAEHLKNDIADAVEAVLRGDYFFEGDILIAERVLAIPAIARMIERDTCPDCIRCGNCQDAPALSKG